MSFSHGTTFAEFADQESTPTGLQVARRNKATGLSCPAYLHCLGEESELAHCLDDGPLHPSCTAPDLLELGAPRPRKALAAPPLERSEALRQIQALASRHRLPTQGPPQHSKSTPVLRPQRQLRPPRSASNCCCASVLRGLWSSLCGAPKEGERPSFGAPESSAVIFDWDDTLLPTSFIVASVLPTLPPKERGGAVPKDCPYYEELAAHAKIVAFALRAASSVAQVAIVTNSLQPWVLASSERYLPGLELKALLQELRIPVYYARRHVPYVQVNVTEEEFFVEVDRSEGGRVGCDIIPEGDGSLEIASVEARGLIGQWNREHPEERVQPGDRIVEVNNLKDNLAAECRKAQPLRIKFVREVSDMDPYTEAKRIDMEACLQRFYGKRALRWNVISVGDSMQEQDALKQVLAAAGQTKGAAKPVCKSVNLLNEPDAGQLSDELRIIMVWLPRMVEYSSDFDVCMDRLHDLERKLFH